MDDAHFLPNDLAACQRLLLAAFREAVELEQQVAEAKQQAAELSRVLDETAASYQELQQAHASTLDELAWYRRWTFGRRRERIAADEGQGHLFDLDSPLWGESPVPTTPDPEAGNEVKAHNRRQKRQIDWDKLPQIRHNHDLEVKDQTCSSCGRLMKCIGEDVTRELEYQPAKLEAHIHVRPKYACPRCKDGVSAAPLPPRPIPGGIAGPGLITEVFVGKFGDHLPLYRQEDFFTRHGLHIPRSTLCDWVQAAAELLKPLYERQKELVLQSPVLWTDDTPVTMLTSGKEGSRQGRFWTYIGEQHPYSVYDFTESRARDGPAKFLAGFQGYLHADAYGGYDHIYLGSNDAIREVACWAHARRKFFDARDSSPRDAHQILEWIRQLYDIEDQAQPLSADARREMRASQAEPVLALINARLAELERRTLPKSALAKAVW